MKKTYIVSTYNNYEWITTVDAYCKLELMIKYHLEGYKVWDYPIKLVIFMKKLGITLNWGNKNCFIEKRIAGSEQITHWSAYDNFR